MAFPQSYRSAQVGHLGKPHKKTRTGELARAGPSTNTRFSKLVKRLQADDQIGAKWEYTTDPKKCGRAPIYFLL